jgi:hypothetical protein
VTNYGLEVVVLPVSDVDKAKNRRPGVPMAGAPDRAAPAWWWRRWRGCGENAAGSRLCREVGCG